MRKASDILKAIREDVFGWSQRGFGESLGYAVATVSRLESGKPQHRLSSIHLEKLRKLTPPAGKADLFRALLQEFEAALPAEEEPDLASAEEALRLHTEALSRLDGGIRDAQTAARRAEDAARLAAQIHELAEVRRAEEAQRAEQLRQADEARRAEEVQRAEQLRQADEARRAEEAQRAEQLRQADEARRAEEARQRAEDIRQSTEEVRQAKSAAREAGEAARLAKQSAEVAQQVTMAALKWMRRGRYLTVAVALVVSPIVSTTVVRFTDARRQRDTGTLAREEKAQSAHAEAERSPPQTVPDEEADTAGVDAGTAMTEALLQALPFPPHGVPNQKPAPCSSGDEELDFNGYCYRKAEVKKAGHCEDLRLYEPSPGWCRSHRYGYLPVYTSRKDNNSVDPQ